MMQAHVRRVAAWASHACGRSSALAVAVALILMSLAGQASAQVACPEIFFDGTPPALTDQRLAERTTLLCNDAFASLASGVTRTGLWSAEHLTTASIVAAKRTPRRGQFHADGRLRYADRGQPSDYAAAGYDRGHLAPSGDMPTPAAEAQSFLMSNMVPQAAILNRGQWSEIEDEVRRMATRMGQVYVVTGAAYDDTPPRRIGRGVRVPDFVWKAVYAPAQTAGAAYLCRNAVPAECRVIRLAALSQAVSIAPFPSIKGSLNELRLRLPSPSSRRPLPQ